MDSSTHSKRSLALHKVNALTSRAGTAVVVAILLVGFLIFGAVGDFSRGWVDALDVITSTVTLVMVFVIQHTQARQQTAIQLKLDEILRSAPDASNQLIRVEQASEEELEALEEDHTDLRQVAVDEADSSNDV